jgi:hypothetical protein
MLYLEVESAWGLGLLECWVLHHLLVQGV